MVAGCLRLGYCCWLILISIVSDLVCIWWWASRCDLVGFWIVGLRWWNVVLRWWFAGGCGGFGFRGWLAWL